MLATRASRSWTRPLIRARSVASGAPCAWSRASAVAATSSGRSWADGVAEVVSRTASEHWEVVRFTLPRQLNRYVVEKGSIAVNGTSLTVSAVSEGYFEVSLIPTTLSETTAGALQPGDPVNLEVDVVAKYVEKMVQG